MTELMNPGYNWERIKKAFDKREEIKQQIKELQALDLEIVQWLDEELIVYKHTAETQIYEGPEFTVRAKVPQNWKVDEEKAMDILNKNPNLQPYSDIFQYKLSVRDAEFKKAPEQVKLAFADAVTSTPGKTAYEIKFKEI